MGAVAGFEIVADALARKEEKEDVREAADIRQLHAQSLALLPCERRGKRNGAQGRGRDGDRMSRGGIRCKAHRLLPASLRRLEATSASPSPRRGKANVEHTEGALKTWRCKESGV